MGEPDDEGFSLDEALRARRALRNRLGLGPERFPMPAFVGMISDEIEQLREAGCGDAEIARIVAEAAGRSVEAKDLARHYAPPEARHQSG